MKSATRIYCVIPALNERGNLKTLLDRIEKALSQITGYFTILFVIQGDDGSRQLLEKIVKNNTQVHFHYFPKALGIGRAYKKGFAKIPSHITHVLTLDADLNHDPSVIPSFFKSMEMYHADVVVGSRFIPGGRFLDRRVWKRWASRVVNRIVRVLLRTQVRDVSSGFRLIRSEVVRSVLPQLHETGYPYYMEFLLIAQQKKYKIVEVPITYSARRWGKSKMGTFSTAVEYFKFFSRMFFRLYGW